MSVSFRKRDKFPICFDAISFTAAGAPFVFRRTLAAPTSPGVLRTEDYRHYVEAFNADDHADVAGYIHNAQAWDWMKEQIPFFACPDPDVESTYYYRWWSYRKHIEKTPAGFIITEFLRPVTHATQYNAISCALGHHIAEGRWLAERSYLDQYVAFWLHGGAGGISQPAFHKYSGWLSAALYDRWLVDGNTPYLTAQLDSLLRPSINSYMYGNAKAIAAIAAMAGKPAVEAEYATKAARLRELVQQKLWNPDDRFFETVLASGGFGHVREEIGFTPWFFDLPERGKGYEAAWKQLMDPDWFYAPYGPTTAERRSPGFRIANQGDDCQWNGPSWAFATTITLRSAANVLNDYGSDSLSVQDYFKTLLIYSRSQRIRLPDRRVIPFIDEDQNPLTGEWQARSMKIREGVFYVRGDHYNHSAYADLVITGLVGLRPQPTSDVAVNPLLPAGTWDWFCLDRVRYRGRLLTILWDRTGMRFGKGKGLTLLVDGKDATHSATLGRITAAVADRVVGRFSTRSGLQSRFVAFRSAGGRDRRSGVD